MIFDRYATGRQLNLHDLNRAMANIQAKEWLVMKEIRYFRVFH
jgi:hypothetical protein